VYIHVVSLETVMYTQVVVSTGAYICMVSVRDHTHMGFSGDKCMYKFIQVSTGEVSIAIGYFQGSLSGLRDGINTLRVEDRLDGASKFLSWKSRVTLALKEYDLWELVDKVVVPPTDPDRLWSSPEEGDQS
jgi:hypothetical protein